ncbi:hypothetical protein BKH40_08585 [Helicobacter sp. 11S02629-2]|nr:hypothetical protein BKH40_08585 [Helicobacter sp. 11S02629-2]
MHAFSFNGVSIKKPCALRGVLGKFCLKPFLEPCKKLKKLCGWCFYKKKKKNKTSGDALPPCVFVLPCSS